MATPPQSTQRPPDSSPVPIEDDDSELTGSALQMYSGSASLPDTPIAPLADVESKPPGLALQLDSPGSAPLPFTITILMPIGDVESKLLDPVPFVSSATPIEDAAHQIVTSPSGKSVQPNKHANRWVERVNAPILSARKTLMMTTILVPVMSLMILMILISATLRDWMMDLRRCSLVSTISPFHAKCGSRDHTPGSSIAS